MTIYADTNQQRLTITEHIREFWSSGCKCKVCSAVDRQERIVVKEPRWTR